MATCAFCNEETDVDVPDSYAYDLKWACPCGGTNVIEGQGPEGVPDELRSVTPHLQPVPPSDPEAEPESEPEPDDEG